jgi:DNA-directed RNA polymerase specialized sigma24 family protein
LLYLFAMHDLRLAAALRSRSPDALPELLDTYGDRLFSYCWCLLRNRENAQIAVRDALVVATAQIERLVRDEWLVLWLYSLARAQCLRREPVPAADADEPVAPPHSDAAGPRLMAWKAVAGLPAAEAEALELDSRHHVDLRLVLGLSEAEVQVLLDQGRQDLERALGAELLIRKSHACLSRSAVLSDWTGTIIPAVLSDWTGTIIPAVRDRVLEHAATCPVCGPNLPRSVSAARVFALLPAPALSPVARMQILGFFDDSRMAAYREFTVSAAGELAGSSFLSAPGPGPAGPAVPAGPEPARSSPEADAIAAPATPAARPPPRPRPPSRSQPGPAGAALGYPESASRPWPPWPSPPYSP